MTIHILQDITSEGEKESFNENGDLWMAKEWKIGLTLVKDDP